MASACCLLVLTLMPTVAAETVPSPPHPVPPQQEAETSPDWLKPSLVTIPRSALTLSEANGLLNEQGNVAITEWGSKRSRPLVYQEEPNPLSWWAAVTLISEHFGLDATPASSGWQLTTRADEWEGRRPSSQATSRSSSSTTPAEPPATLNVDVQVFCEPLALSEPTALKPSPTVIGQDLGPWRIQTFVRNRVHRRSLRGNSRWVELDFRVLGEPRLSALGQLSASLELTAATLSTDPHVSRSLRNTTPLPGPEDNSEVHGFRVIGGHRPHIETAVIQPMAVIADLHKDDPGLTLHGQLHLAQLRPWNQQVQLIPNRWQSLTLGQHALMLLLLTDLNKQAALSDEHAISIRLLRRPGLIIAEANQGTVDPSLWQQLNASLDHQPVGQLRPNNPHYQATGEAVGSQHQAIWLPLVGLAGIVHADPEKPWNIQLSAAISSDRISIPFTLDLPLLDEQATHTPDSATRQASDMQGGPQP